MTTDPLLCPEELSFQDLRLARSVARRQLELAAMRLPAHEASTEHVLKSLRERAHLLTEELISRYSRDLALVDLLLDSPYPAEGATPRAAGLAAPEVTS